MDHKEQQLKYQLDLTDFKHIAEGSPASNRQLNLDISTRIGEAIQKVFSNMNRWADDFKKLVYSNRSLEAYQLFMANKENLSLLKVSLSEEMLSLERSALNSEQLKEYLFYLIILASKEHKIGKVEAVIDEYLQNFIADTEPSKLQTVWLAKANAAGQNGKFNVAYNTYLQVIGNGNTAAIDLAYAYRGLYLITSDQKEKLNME